jgi:molybdopterin molybdotransferase
LHVADDEAAVEGAIKASLEASDVLIVVGGVSVGDRDYVKGALDAAGVETVFWRVRVKPGKPFLFGKRGTSLVFGLPGNPVSAFVSFHLLVAPALRRWMGASEGWLLPVEMRCVLGAGVSNRGDRPQYVTGRVDRAARRFIPLGIQQSHAIGALAGADGMVRVEAGGTLDAGVEVSVLEL